MNLLIDLPAKLRNETVMLRKIEAADFDKLFAVAADPKIWEQHPSRERYKKGEFQKYFDGAVASSSAFLVFDAGSFDLIGCTRFYDYKPNESSIAIGYTFLAKKYWGGHYNSRMKALLIDYAFQYVDKIIFHIAPTNIRSQKGTLKLGAVQSGEVMMDSYGTNTLQFEYELRKCAESLS